ncbi:MAG TPA: hypothetical protein PKD12_15400 [Nitrospira sp.]|nr:hypothetical protein [Nitrospira sp.]
MRFSFILTHIWRSSSAIVCMAYLFLNACSFTRPAEDTVFVDGPRGTVSLRSVEDSWFKTAHPVSMNPLLLTHVLRGVQAQPAPNDQTTTLRVFSEEEIAFLGPLMSTALSKATKNQLVDFRVVRDRKGGNETTGGLLFARGRLFHLWLTHYRAPSAGTAPGAGQDRQSRNPQGLTPRQLRFVPETVQQPSYNQQPDVIDPPPLATLVIDYPMLAAALNLPSESTHANSIHREPPSPIETEPQAAQPEPSSRTSHEIPSARAEETQALKERVREQATELDVLKEDVRALRNRLSEIEAPTSDRRKPAAPPR